MNSGPPLEFRLFPFQKDMFKVNQKSNGRRVVLESSAAFISSIFFNVCFPDTRPQVLPSFRFPYNRPSENKVRTKNYGRIFDVVTAYQPAVWSIAMFYTGKSSLYVRTTQARSVLKGSGFVFPWNEQPGQ